MRLAQTQVWPELRNLEAMAPCTAASRSASSKTMNGALPPSSIDTFFMCPMALAASVLPTAVDPVKVILRSLGFSHISAAISAAPPVTMLMSPLGKPASSASTPRARAE